MSHTNLFEAKLVDRHAAHLEEPQSLGLVSASYNQVTGLVHLDCEMSVEMTNYILELLETRQIYEVGFSGLRSRLKENQDGT